MVGIDTHFLHSTQPCWRDITGGQLRCYCEDRQMTAVWRGYVPLLDPDGVKCFTVIGERYADLIEGIRIGQPVTVTRERQAGQPISVRKSEWTDAPMRANPENPLGYDLRPTLVQLWGDKTVQEWFASQGNAVTDPLPAKRTRANVVSDAVRERQRAAAGNDLPPTAGDVMGGLPILNGKKKHG